MPKLIIPNAYELYQSGDTPLTQQDINARYFYNLRFLWLLEPGDIIILPKVPPTGFISYLAKIKNIDPHTLHLVILNSKYSSVNSESLSDPDLIFRFKKIITCPSTWSIQACFFSRDIAILADQLSIPIFPKWRALIESNFIRKVNSKAEFRKLSITHNIPIPEGILCLNPEALADSLKSLLKVTGQVILKKEYGASGKGNIGISFHKDHPFVGVIQTITLKKEQSINEVAYQLWSEHINSYNKLFVAEVYYPNKGSFTTQFWTSPQEKEPILLGYSEILMESRWVGVQIPPRILSQEQKEKIIGYSNQFASILQQYGYNGYLCCDAILTKDDNILFTEINVRPGAETNVYILAKHLFGVGYQYNMVIKTLNNLKIHSFINIHQQLKDENLLLDHGKRTGIVLLTVDDTYCQQLECLIAGPNSESTFILERKLNNILKLHVSAEENTISMEMVPQIGLVSNGTPSMNTSA